MAKRRRSVLAAAVSVVGSAFAGCLGGDGGNGSDNRSNRTASGVDGDPETPPTVASTYPQFQYDAGNTGWVAEGSGPTGGIAALFEFGSVGSGRRLGSPSVADGRVYVTAAAAGGGDGTATSDAGETVVSAVDAVRGTTVWEQPYRATGDPGPTAVTDDTVLAPVGGSVVALAAATGDQRWSYACGLASGLTVADGSVYVVGTQDGAAKLYSLSVADGSVRWEADIDAETTQTTPAVADDTVYVGGSALQTFATSDGSEGWRVETAVTVSPAVVEDSVVVGSDGAVGVYDTDGAEQWSADLESEESPVAPHPPAVADGTVYVSAGGELAAYDLDDGEQAYAVELGVDGTPVVADDYVYLFGPGQLTCLSADDAETEWAYGTQQRDSTEGVAPAVVDGVAYFPAEQLYAIAE